MARVRNIKPTFFTNETLVMLPCEARLLFIGLWTLADRDGRLEDRPMRIKASVFPYENIEVDKLLNDLHKHRFICRYIANDVKCIQINNFTKHQKPHPHEAKSDLPELPLHVTAPTDIVRPSNALTLACTTCNSLTCTCTALAFDKPKGLSSAAFAADSDVPVSEKEIDADLSTWLTWWNSLRLEQLVASGVDEHEPSKGVLSGWKRVKKSPALRELLSDRDAIEREIRNSTFCRESWFRLERLFGGSNRDGEFIIKKLLDGGYRNKATGMGSADPRGNFAALGNYLQSEGLSNG